MQLVKEGAVPSHAAKAFVQVLVQGGLARQRFIVEKGTRNSASSAEVLEEVLIRSGEVEMKTIRFCSLFLFGVVAALIVAHHARSAGGAKAGPAAPAGLNFVLVAHGGAGDHSRMTPERIEVRRAAMVIIWRSLDLAPLVLSAPRMPTSLLR